MAKPRLPEIPIESPKPAPDSWASDLARLIGKLHIGVLDASMTMPAARQAVHDWVDAHPDLSQDVLRGAAREKFQVSTRIAECLYQEFVIAVQ